MSGAEGIGEAVSGAMIARAVEPTAGEHEPLEPDGRCLNCGTELRGAYCHGCGQPGHVHRSVAAWWHDVAHSVLHFEGKIWRTLPLLGWRPGELTRRYVAGERARFVSPIALFLFTVFLMFAVFSAAGAPLIDFGAGDDPRAVAAEIREADARIERLRAQRRAAASRARDHELARIDEALAEARMERRTAGVVSGRDRLFGGEIDTGWERLDKGLRKANENPALLGYKVQNNAYKFSWALIPISLPFLWILFLRRRSYRERYGAYDHLVFITYSISFMSMLLIAVVLIRSIGFDHGLLNLATILIPPVHIYRQLRGAYGLSGFGALWRTLALLVLAFVAIALFGILLLLLGVLV